MKQWKIIQTQEFEDWYKQQDDDAQEDIFAKIQILAHMGPGLGRPYVDTVEGSRFSNMKELRVQTQGRPFRIFFAFDPKRQAVMLMGGNKQGQKRFYQELIRLADQLFQTYLEDQENEKT